MNESQDPFEGSEITTILVASDLEKSKEFYVQALGASLFREYGGDSAVIQLMNHWMLLVKPGGPTEDKPNTYFKTPGNKEVVSHSFTIRVKNCRQTYKILSARGVEFITPPVTRGYETRCFFYDPDGHLFEISEYNSE